MSYDFWRCTECGNLVAQKNRPERCLNCRTGDSELTEYPLYEQVEL